MSALGQKRTLFKRVAMFTSCHRRKARGPPERQVPVLPAEPVVQAAALCAAGRWHHELVSSAAVLNDLRAIAKLQILRQAQPHFGQASAGASDRDRASRQTGIGFDESVFDTARRNVEWLFEIGIIGWDFHRRAGLAHRLEIGAWRLA